jgi:hypothetical protein
LPVKEKGTNGAKIGRFRRAGIGTTIHRLYMSRGGLKKRKNAHLIVKQFSGFERPLIHRNFFFSQAVGVLFVVLVVLSRTHLKAQRLLDTRQEYPQLMARHVPGLQRALCLHGKVRVQAWHSYPYLKGGSER